MQRLRSTIYGFLAGIALVTVLIVSLSHAHRKNVEIAQKTQEMLHSSYYHCQNDTDPRTCVFDPDAYLAAEPKKP